MTIRSKRTYYPGKNPVVSLVSLILLVVLIGLTLMFGANSDDHFENPPEAAYSVEASWIRDC